MNANIVSMTDEKILRDQTVIIDGNKVCSIGRKSAVKTPPNTLVIDCLGRYYLMPGLADMHVHVWNESDLLLFVANGVTTIRNMWRSQRQLSWRRRVAKGTLLGPTIYSAGALLDGDPPLWKDAKVIRNPQAARTEVAREKRTGYDFVKVYNRLSPSSYKSIVAAAKKCGMPVAGHVPDAVGLHGVLAAGQASIEHLDGYLRALQHDDSPTKENLNLNLRYGAVEHFDRRKIPQLAEATRDAKVWNCVTLVVFQKWVLKEEASRLLAQPAMRFVRPQLREEWDPSKNFLLKGRSAENVEGFRKADQIRRQIVAAMKEAGAKILLGTDTPNPLVIPGFSIHEELQNLVDAGLSPYEAIKAGTRDAAAFLDASGEFGTIETGGRADLILTEDDPLMDVQNVSRRVGVMVRGRWLTEAKLQRMLEDLVASYVPAEAQ